MSLYLKYRPSDFTNLVGQEFTKNTLQKAISQDKTVGAYLFCGPRGTGKTSSARIFAKTINCLNSKDGNPCLECKICVDFADERLVDIIEIDAASHTGVDNMREIIERAQFTPNFCKFKIYIIDEVHMLSKGAFNALLKILEEPPSHVKFILATTETHKVPETIISRCQRYDFKRISAVDIKNRLLYIAGVENISIDEKSLEYIVKNSGGGLRNAISLFEQLIHDNSIKYDLVIEKLGIVDEDLLQSFLSKLLTHNVSIVDDFEQLVTDGKNMKLFFKELIFFTKNEALQQIKTHNNSDIQSYLHILDILDETYGKTKVSLDENTTLIIGVLKIISQYSNSTSTENNLVQKTSPIIKNNSKTAISETKPEVIEKENNTVNKEVSHTPKEISHNDVFDVFGTENIVPTAKTNISENKAQHNGIFDQKAFIDTLKKSGAKGGLTMALRGSGFELLGGNTLIITTKTKIASNQVQSVDNISLMRSALEKMGIESPEIKTN
ncbi:MAG: DNA polymerase III subunit gamma/tau [Candidatus Gracilibacteria bacterium]|nr:DNA polymerase III subunit gamma/tau [Candidatus Gracilibacteria bacterium]